METKFTEFKLKEEIKSNYKIELSKEEVIDIANKNSSIDSNKEDFIRVSDIDFGNFSIINPQKRTRKSTYIADNPFMKYHDESEDWKEYPKRSKCLIFANYKANFFDTVYYVIPLDKMFDMSIAETQRKDFNFTNLEYENIKGKKVKYYIHNYLENDKAGGATYFKPKDFNKNLITPEALGFKLFKYKDIGEVILEKEFYTEMPCILIKYLDDGVVIDDGVKTYKEIKEHH